MSRVYEPTIRRRHRKKKYLPTVLSHPVRHVSAQSSGVGYVINPDWPDDMVALMKSELERGQSRGQIATTINESGRWPKNRKTRSAVIGKIDRLGIGDTKGSPTKEPRAKEPKASIWTRPLDELIVKLYDAGNGLTTGAIADHLAVEHDLKLTHQAVRFRLTDLGKLIVKGEVVKHSAKNRGAGKHHTPTLVEIIEEKPATSVRSHDTDAGQCQWPTSPDVRDLHVCGQKAVCGAYCEKHGALAYRKRPSARRAGAFHKVDADWQKQLT